MPSRTRRERLVVVLAATLLLALAVPAGAQPPDSAGESGVIPGRFIVTLADGVNANVVAAEYGRRSGAAVDFVYTAALNGFAGSFQPGEVSRLRGDGRVTRVEPDGHVKAIVDYTGTTAQSDATWGIDRIDERARKLDKTYHYATTASGVTVYIIDTGIRATHEDFGGRVSTTHGFNAFDDGVNYYEDCQGHGTHVASTAAGTTYGVAKQAKLSSVRVLNCSGSGTWSGVIGGIDWVTSNAQKPAVANMSLGGGANSSVDAAVANSVNSGVVYAVAAGNDSGDACRKSPARASEALTVGATASNDSRTSWSNYGKCVDLFAPGASITAAGISSDTATRTISGTSMASPHVAGVAALYLQANQSAPAAPGTSGSVHDAIVANATPGVVSGSGRGSPNLLLHSLFGSASEPTEPIDEPKDDPVVAEYVITTPDGETGYTTNGGKNSDRHMSVTVSVADGEGQAVAGATVAVTIVGENGASASGSGTTGSDGRVTFSWSNAPSTCYTTTATVNGVAGLTPTNRFCK